MATRKYNPENRKSDDDDFLAGIRQNKGGAKAAGSGNQQENETADKASNEKKTLFNIKVNDSTLKAWKRFCLEHDITLTFAIKRAMAHLIDGVKNGSVEI